eukprot:scaffold266_cov391-Prasinococcus_capsulatus_cf.AAC.3
MAPTMHEGRLTSIYLPVTGLSGSTPGGKNRPRTAMVLSLSISSYLRNCSITNCVSICFDPHGGLGAAGLRRSSTARCARGHARARGLRRV